jgi:type I pantothenate kinase
VLAGLLRRGPAHRTVDLLTTDGFLYPNRILEQRGLLDRKGFPETYDDHALTAALDAVRAGQPEVGVPVYSHESYDIVPGQVQWIRRPDLLVVEGLTVLQGALGAGPLVDLAIYVDADEASVARWHTERLLALRSDVDAEPSDFQRWFTSLSEVEAHQVAASSWSEINLVNLRQHVAPTRGQADVILEKDADHRVHRVLLRTGSVPVG